MSRIDTRRSLSLALAWLALWSCGGPSDVSSEVEHATPHAPVLPSSECAALWDTEIATSFVDLLKRTTSREHPVWIDLRLSDPSYVLSAGQTEAGRWCLGLFAGGRAVDFEDLPAEPAWSTSLYGFYFGQPRTDRSTGEVTDDTGQPAVVHTWLEEHGVEHAVLAPVDPTGLPFEIPALLKVQLVAHEAFHLLVQMPVWNGRKGHWPAWDLQPDRTGVRRCFGEDEEITGLYAAEREALASTAEALLDGDRSAACRHATSALTLEAERRSEIDARGLRVQRDEETVPCREAEDIWEAIEGTADYASWLPLFESGFATRDQLLRRYRAQQADGFYLTGAIKMHAAQVLRESSPRDLWQDVAASHSAAEGSPHALFAAAVADACGATGD